MDDDDEVSLTEDEEYDTSHWQISFIVRYTENKDTFCNFGAKMGYLH